MAIPKPPSRPVEPPPAAAAPEGLRAGDVLAGKYALVRHLGVGSMGQVWVARNEATRADVAVKVLLPERVAAPDAIERFRREAHAMAALSHRGIVRCFDLVELDRRKGSLLLVMELLRGQTLAERLAQARRLSIAEALAVVLPILSALEHAHAQGVVHRDLKPENVFLAHDPDGAVLPKLVDFGISKLRTAGAALTARGALVGTPCYMSPEQARGDEATPQSDVFAAGILLYECLSGRPPFGGDTLFDCVRSVLDTEPAALDDVPVDLWNVVARALAKSLHDRYASAAELAKALVEAVPGRAAFRSVPPAPTSQTSVPPAVARTTLRPPEPAPRSRRWRVAGAACALAAAAVLVMTSRRHVGEVGGETAGGAASGVTTTAALSSGPRAAPPTLTVTSTARPPAPAVAPAAIPAPPATATARVVPRVTKASQPESLPASVEHDAGAATATKVDTVAPGALVRDPGF